MIQQKKVISRLTLVISQIAAYQRAIALKPDFVLAHRNLSGLVAKDLTD